MIKNHSLHQANVVVVFPAGFVPPENHVFMGSVDAANAQGMNFVDDPVTQTKVLSIPKLNITAALEGRKLRIEDQALSVPEKHSPFIATASSIIKTIAAPHDGIDGIGFNFNLYCQVNHVIDIQRIFKTLYQADTDFGGALLDIGWQWTVAASDGKTLDGYFVKVTAPLEIAVHHNRHLKKTTLPPADVLHKEYLHAYQRTFIDIDRLMV